MRRPSTISGGGSSYYSNTLSLLAPGDRVWVKAPGFGFVGVGEVTGTRQSANDSEIDNKPALDTLTGGHYHRQQANAPYHCEYFVPIRWFKIVPIAEAINKIGLFGNQNTVCKPRTPKWRTTVERLRQAFGIGTTDA